MTSSRHALRTLAFFLLVALLAPAVGCSDDSPPLEGNNGGSNNGGTNNGGTNNGGTNNGKLPAGSSCTDPSQCQSGVCIVGKCTDATCSDGEKNGTETDVDCGALGCPKCDIGKACEEDTQCVSGICNDNVCVDKNCMDGVQNGLETDVDCGFLCGPCDDGLTCAEDTDCVSGICSGETCAAPTCTDSAKNGEETDVDCGGPDCDPCPEEGACAEGSDCETGVCQGDVCAAPTCDDSVINGDETDVDCGGQDCGPCDDGRGCERDDDCTSQVCADMTDMCAAPACDDGVKNGTETDRDCGGDCSACAPGNDCAEADDCVSGICDSTGSCTAPTCEDSVINGTETDVDCGGDSCPGCDKFGACNDDTDCRSRNCTIAPSGDGLCDDGACDDGTYNPGTETDVDCGDTCEPCAAGLDCVADSDCFSGNCNNDTCQMATCNDGIHNGDETDVDCGGSCSDKCTPGDGCSFGVDCTTGVCLNGSCQSANCQDGTLNGTETDIDCGGDTCSPCKLAETCAQDIDCESMICDGGMAGPYCAECMENDTQLTSQRCGYELRGRVEQTCVTGFWQNSSCEGVWYGSCWEILDAGASTGDGLYNLDPDGPGTLYDEFEVFCDMTTDGGGWTEITPCLAQRELNGDLVAIDTAATARLDGDCRPFTRDEGDGHTYHYTFAFPAGYSQFYFEDLEMKANADPNRNDTSDLGFVQTSWSVAAGANRGDVSFGSGSSVGPVRSFSQAKGAGFSCNSCTYQWPGGDSIEDVGGESTKFRIGWGEEGSQYEGWYPWWSGAIRLR